MAVDSVVKLSCLLIFYTRSSADLYLLVVLEVGSGFHDTSSNIT